MVCYHPSTHPDVFDELKNGFISIHRTEKSFSGSPIDLTLEQIVNADEANQKKGIKSIANLISARQHWAESSSLTLSRLWGTGGGVACGLCPKSKARGVLAHRLPRFILLVSFSDTLLVVSILDFLLLQSWRGKGRPFSLRYLTIFGWTLNSFGVSVDKRHLFNIATGKSAQEEASPFLLSIHHTVSEMRQKFTEECRKQLKCFEEWINGRKLYAFQTECGNKKIPNKYDKVKARVVRDIFGTGLSMSLENSIDMAEVLQHSLIVTQSCWWDWATIKSKISYIINYETFRVKSEIYTPYLNHCHNYQRNVFHAIAS